MTLTPQSAPVPVVVDAGGLLPVTGVSGVEDVAATWLAVEDLLLPGRYCGTEPPDSLYALAPTRRPHVLVTAPHAVVHHRPERRKGADVASGGLALNLAALLGARCLVAAGEQSQDGNRSSYGTFKQAVHAAIDDDVTVIFDVHGMADSFAIDVCLGTGADEAGTRRLYEPLRQALEAQGRTVSVNDPWGAAHPDTVTNTAHGRGVAAVQLEVANRWRQPWDHAQRSAHFVLGLASAAESALTPS